MTCTHWWRLGEQSDFYYVGNKAMVDGHCKLCDAVKAFSASEDPKHLVASPRGQGMKTIHVWTPDRSISGARGIIARWGDAG